MAWRDMKNGNSKRFKKQPGTRFSGVRSKGRPFYRPKHTSRAVGIALSLAIALVLVFAAFSMPVNPLIAWATSEKAGEDSQAAASIAATDPEIAKRISLFTMKWSDDNSGSEAVLSGNTLTLTPSSRIRYDGGVTSTTGRVATVELGLGVTVGTGEPDETIPAGKLNISIPAYIFFNRDGKAQGAYQVGVSSHEGGEGTLVYKIDRNGTPDNYTDDKIILYNQYEINVSRNFTVRVSYLNSYRGLIYTPEKDYAGGMYGNTSDLRGGDGKGNNEFKNDFKAELSVTDKGMEGRGEEAWKQESDSLIVKVKTKLNTQLFKSLDPASNKGSIGMNYDEAWWTQTGQALPSREELDKYFYTKWQLDIKTSGAQPGIHHLVDTPADEGELIAWQTSKGYVAPKGDDKSLAIDSEIKTDQSYVDPMTVYAIVRYPKTLIKDGKATIRNKAQDKLIGLDGFEASSDDSAEYTWDYQKFVYPPGNYGLQKLSQTRFSGSVDNSLSALLAGEDNKLQDPSYWFTVNSENLGGELTFEDGADRTPENAGKRAYTVDVSDDFVGLAGERLNPIDYEIKQLKLADSWYTATGDYMFGDRVEQSAEEDPQGVKQYILKDIPVEKWSDITYWYETTYDNQWKKLGTFHYEQSRSGVFTSALTGETTRNGNAIDLPQGTVGVRYTYQTNSAKTAVYGMNVKVQLKSTPHVKSILNKAKPSENGDWQAQLTNVATLSVFDADGKAANHETSDSIEGGAYKEAIENRDEAFGFADNSGHNKVYPRHELGTYTLTQKMANSDVNKFSYYENDPSNKRIKIKYSVDAYEKLAWHSENPDLETANTLGFNMQHGGIFYDLLPLGMNVDKSTNRIYKKSDGLDSYKDESYKDFNDTYSGSSLPFSIDYRENWRGTGRTMMIITVRDDSSDNYACVKGGNNLDTSYWMISGYHINYIGYYPWQAASESGSDVSFSVKNSVAFQSNGTISQGFRDSGGIISEKDLMKDLDEDGDDGSGADTKEPPNVIYGENTIGGNYVGSTETSSDKFVKASGDAGWSKETAVLAGQSYSYRLSLSGKNPDTQEGDGAKKNIVFYDSIEQHEDASSRNRWYGTFDSIDTAQVEAMGAKPKYYYSNQVLDVKNDAAARNLADVSKWTETNKAFTGVDKSKVKSIAVDLSKNKNDGDFTLPADVKKAATITINMIAPTSVKDVLGYQKENALALNDSYIGADKQTSGGWISAGLPTGYTTVSISADVVDFEFTKVAGSVGANATVLPGATFRLYHWKGAAGSEPENKPINRDDPGTDWERAKNAGTGQAIGDITSDKDGKVSFPNLEKGTYRLVETAAPSDYELPSGQWSVYVDPALNTDYKYVVTAIDGADGKQPPAFAVVKGSDNKQHLQLPNYKIQVLPVSGAGGTAVLTMVGLALVAGVAVWLARTRGLHRYLAALGIHAHAPSSPRPRSTASCRRV